MSGTLIVRSGAVNVPQETLLQMGTPEPTHSWRPLPPSTLVSTLGKVLSTRGLTGTREEL